MGLQSTTPHALGRKQRVYAKTETTPGTYVKAAGVDAIKTLKFDVDYKQNREDRADGRPTRALLERYSGKKIVNWNLESYLLASGVAGTAPDIDPVLKALFGVSTNNPGTSQVYTFSDSQSALGAVSFLAEMDSVVSQALAGAIVDDWGIKAGGAQVPTMTFAGRAYDMYHTGTSTLNGNVASSATIVVQTADKYNFEVGSLIGVGSNNNLLILTNSAPSFTVDSTISATSGDSVFPYAPTETTAGTPATSIDGSIKLDTVAIPVIGLELGVKNHYKYIDDEYGSALLSDAIVGFREVTGNFTMRARKDQILHLGKRKLSSFASRVAQVNIGTTGGKIWQFDWGQIEMDFSKLEVPQSDEATFTLPFTALASTSTAADELILTVK